MKLYRSILIVLLIAVAGIALFSWSSWRDKHRAINAQLWVTHTHEAIKNLDEIWILANRNESAMRGYAGTGNSAFIQHYDSNFAVIQKHIGILQHLLSDNKEQLLQLGSLDSNLRRKLEFETTVRTLASSNRDSASRLVAGMHGKKIMDEVSKTLKAMKSEEQALLRSRTAQTYYTPINHFKTVIVGAGVTFLFILVILLRLNRDINLRRLAQSSLSESEKRYREFIENAGVVSFTSDGSGYFTFISNQVEALTGYTVVDLLGKHFTMLIHKDHVEHVAGHYAKQRSSNTHETSITFPIIHKNGGVRWVEQDTILLSKDGDVTGYQSVVKDITDKMLMNERLLEMERERTAYQVKVQAILDNTPLAIYVKDMDGKYILVNKQFRESFNVSDEQIIGKTIYDIGGKSDISRHVEADLQVVQTGKPVEVEDVFALSDGQHHVLTVKFPLFDHKNTMFGISGFMKDISEMVRNREELISARQRAESAEMLQEQFLANMSHEIRTPMNGIIGVADLLRKTKLEKAQIEYVEIIKQSSDNLLVLINDILDFSKIKAGKISIEKIPFRLEPALNALTAGFRIKADEKKIRFSFLMHPGVPLVLKGDPHRLNQILSNLLSNAMKFTSEGHVMLEVGVKEITEQHAIVSFQVNDTGIGIDEKNLSSIFDSFTQASTSTTRKYGGTGLGLAITKRLVELQSGEIHISSRLGAGSSFTVYLPFGLGSLSEVEQSVTSEVIPAARSLDFTGRTVLIVEDNEINRIVLQSNLKQFNLNVAVATDGLEAVQYMRQNRDTDLILMDLHMPGMDGFEATETIRHQLHLQTPIVVLSASALKNDKQRSLDLGANEYLTKPFKPEDLQACLKRFFGAGVAPQTEAERIEKGEKADPQFDLSNLMQLEDGETILMLAGMFETMVPEGLSDLKQSAVQEEWDKVRNISHKLKSSLGVIQIDSILANMSSVELWAKNGENLNSILPLVDESIECYHATLPSIKSEIAKAVASM